MNNTTSAILIKPDGIHYERKINNDDIPIDARYWKYKGTLVYSLIENTGEWLKIEGNKRYMAFEPTTTSSLLPEKLWRAKKAAPIRKVFTYKESLHEKINMGLGIAFVCVCFLVLFILVKG